MKPSLRNRVFAPISALALAVSACTPATTPPSTPGAPAEARAVRPPVDNRTAVRVGVVLPEEGGPAYQRQYADAVLEGVEVAVAEMAGDPRFRVEHVRAEGGSAETYATAVRSLAAQGVVAIIAPLAEDQIAGVAAARPDPRLAILGPTAARSFGQLPHVYSLNVPDTLGAAALGAHAARRGLAPMGVLRARSPAAQAQARAFAAGYTGAGGRAPLELSYENGTTTFSTVLRRFRTARVGALFVAAEERDVRQILPQVRYYGLEQVQVLATGGWATPDGVERIGRTTLEGALITLPFLAEDTAAGWQQFQQLYEGHFRRRLESPIPALGYDAARLALAGLSTRGTAAEVATALAAGGEVAGATGRLRVQGGSVLRRPWVVRVQQGRLIPQSATGR